MDWPTQRMRTDPVAREPLPPPLRTETRPYGTSTADTVWHDRYPTSLTNGRMVAGQYHGGSTSRPCDLKKDAAVTDQWAVPVHPTSADDDGARKPLQNPSRIDTRFALYGMSRAEVDASKELVNYNMDVERLMRILPTHHMNAVGELAGYRFSTPPHDTCGALPVNRNMFHGTSAVQCTSSQTQGHGGVNADSVRLLADIPKCVDTMRTLMEEISSDAQEATNEKTFACLDCMPCNTDNKSEFGDGSGMNNANASRVRDSRKWVCDEPVTIGIYQAYVRKFNNSREHRLFLVCTGGSRVACDEFLNLNIDLSAQTDTTAGDLCESEEVWWLRKMCSRMRARLLHRAATAFGLKIPVMPDVQSFNTEQLMAVTHIETLNHDISALRDETVAVFNECVDTTKMLTGSMCTMNRSEGFWLFKGCPTPSNGMQQDYGGAFGKHNQCGVLHTSASRLSGGVQRHSMANGCPVVTDIGGGGAFVYKNDADSGQSAQHMKFDETFMKNLELMQWQRDNGLLELMPIVVGVFS